MSITHLNSPFIQVGCAKKIYRVDGTPIQVGDTVKVYLQDNSAKLSGFPTANLVVVRLSEDKRSFVYDRRVAGQNFRFDDIAQIHEQHNGSCAKQCSYSLISTVEITAFTIAGVSIPLTTNPTPLSAVGAANLRADIKSYLDSVHPQTSPLPSVNVEFIPDVDPGGDPQPGLSINISATVLQWDSINEGIVPTQVCPNLACDYVTIISTENPILAIKTETQNPIPLPNYPYTHIIEDTNQLEADLNAFLGGNGHAEVHLMPNANPLLSKIVVAITGTTTKFVNMNNGTATVVSFVQSNCK